MINCSNRNEIYSFHPSGANFLYGDGSVRFHSETLDSEVFASLYTRAAGDTASVRECTGSKPSDRFANTLRQLPGTWWHNSTCRLPRQQPVCIARRAPIRYRDSIFSTYSPEPCFMSEPTHSRRVIQIGQRVIGPPEPRAKTIRPRRRSDYPAVAAAHLDVAERLTSPLLMGPPLCDELVALVQHLFNEEEAAVVRHLGLRGKTAESIACAEHRPVDELRPILDELDGVKRAIASSGPDGKKKYHLMPVMPGIFESVLIGSDPQAISPWHRRFAELFEALYETGYSVEYIEGAKNPARLIRFLPVGRAIETHPMALPSDRLEVILDRYQTFGVGQCQCRMTMQVTGRSCGKPTQNCTVMGEWAEKGIEQGVLRRVSRQEILQIKREAEEHGMVNWIMNLDSPKGQISCSCCGCCCHAMRQVNEFSAPATIAPPHFLPKVDPARCNHCGKCAKRCPMAALRVDLEAKTYEHRIERCIGCGVCAVACDTRQAIAMEAVPSHKLPYQSWFSLLVHSAPAMARSAWKVWRSR